MNKLVIAKFCFVLVLLLTLVAKANSATSSTNIIYACASKGRLYVRLAGADHTCRRSEIALQWNIEGPQGPIGPQGSSGDAGVQGPSGPAGTSVNWTVINDTAVQASPQSGYFANNEATEVTVQLPDTPPIGSIIRIAGIGTGGWKVVQNIGQSINVKTLNSSDWVAREGKLDFQRTAIASSADGTKLAAAEAPGYIYLSGDSGLSWTAVARDAVRFWKAIASWQMATNWLQQKLTAKFIRPVILVKPGHLETLLGRGRPWRLRRTEVTWLLPPPIIHKVQSTRLMTAGKPGRFEKTQAAALGRT